MKFFGLNSLPALWRKSMPLKLAGGYLLTVLLLAGLAPLLPLQPNALDLANPYLPPFADFASGHWLGTDRLGRDVLANLVYGFRTGLLIGVPVMLVATVVGIAAGSLAAWFGNRGLRVSRAAILCALACILPVFFYGYYRRQLFLEAGRAQGGLAWLLELAQSMIWVIAIGIIFWLLFRVFKTVGFLAKKVAVPLDELVLKLMEVLSSLPRLVLILSLSALLAPGIGNVVLLLCLTYWAGPARLARAEVLKIKSLPYIEAGRTSGLPPGRLLLRHILPNAAIPLITAFTFGLGSLIGLEATLSFLGIGLPPETPSLGRLLAAYRSNMEAWWLLVFPAVLLYFLILSLQIIGNSVRKTAENTAV